MAEASSATTGWGRCCARPCLGHLGVLWYMVQMGGVDEMLHQLLLVISYLLLLSNKIPLGFSGDERPSLNSRATSHKKVVQQDNNCYNYQDVNKGADIANEPPE